MQYFIILFVLFLNVGVAFADPAIDTATGTFSDGGTITVSGTGFGATGPNVVFFDSFEKGTTGNLVSLVTGSADIGEWDAVYNSGGPDNTYSASFSHSGSKSMLSDYRTYWGGGPNTRFPDVQNSNILISFWAMIPTGRDVPGTNNVDGANWKLFWVGDGNDAFPWGSDMAIECVSSDCSTTETLAALDDGGTPARFEGGPNYDFALVKGQWRRVTVAIRNATSGAFVWQQEVGIGRHEVIVNETNVVTAHSDDPWNFVAVPGFGRGDDNSLVFTDDVYIATGAGARARVEIGNASTYTACTNLSIITPTSWSDTSIAATVRAGSFTTGTAYLYVTDASGVTSPAETITLGGGSGDTTAPVTTISTSDPQSISSAALTVTATCTDAGGVSGGKWRIGSPPDASNGTSCTGTTSLSCATSGYANGANTLYVGCYDAVPNYDNDSITVNYTPSGAGTAGLSGSTTGALR